MSEPLLRAILRLFAVVAKEGDVTRQERELIRMFLQEHLSHSSVDPYLNFFDEITRNSQASVGDDEKIRQMCSEINHELTQKQKIIIILDLVSIIQADGHISETEELLVNTIGESLMISRQGIEAIKTFVLGLQTPELDHENILIVDSAPGSRMSKAKHFKREDLDGFIAVLYAEEQGIYFVKYVGTSEVYLNGVPLKSGKISVLAVGSLLRWEKDDPVYYGEVQNEFKKATDVTPTTFEAIDITYKFRNGNLGLRNINLAEESGNLIALMGASGAGKSTLLHVLNGSEHPSGGQVLINGIDIHRHPYRIKGIIGFVPQDDLLIEDLTVYQNLYFAAKLCFSNQTEEEIDKLVSRVLEDLGLTEIRHLRVGSPLRKTISGGQRKRLNIGLELLREPAVLFCDEPTSGLSSRDSENIIDLLKELAFKGKLVFAVIHQPSSDIFKMFDKLLILDTGGYQIYYGNPVDAISYFKRSINLVNSEEGECHECGNVNPEQIFNIIETKVINEYGYFTNERKIPAEQWNGIYTRFHRPVSITTATAIPDSTLSIPGRLKQTWLFAMRDVRAKLHNTQYLVINLLEAPLLAFILAFIVKYYNPDSVSGGDYIFSKNLNIPAYLFMSVIVALFMGLTVSAEEIIRDRKILKREKFLNLSRSSYLLSKISILFTMSAIQTFLFVLVGNSILEIQGLFIQHWFILFSTACFANMLGLNISSAFNSAVTIYILIPLLLIPQLILSGVVVKFDKLNPTIGNTETVPFVGDMMASRWAFEAAMVTQFKDNRFEREFFIYDQVMADADFKKIYFIPELRTRLQYALNHYASKDSVARSKVDANLKIIRNGIKGELKGLGADKFPQVNDLVPATFDSTLYSVTSDFLNKLNNYYINRFNRADEKKEEKVAVMTASAEKRKEFDRLRNEYHNETVAELVKNVSETNRIIERDGKLIQKIFPVYKTPDPDHLVDFDAQFYMPAKHFLNRNVDTYYFNMGVIWAMTFGFAVALYFNVLRKIINGLGRLPDRFEKK
ncbi:MAG: ATP-binding cassette domain-containing protein [Bacteroidota bacterium]|nr:ATP-binding cassette domain-containing protein [Bacteroidota bacterium]